MPYQLLADVVLVLHFAIVVFVVGGLGVILLGNVRGWAWVNGMGFRILHLLAIATVVAESWLGIACPLTSLESWLRSDELVASYEASFIEHWVSRLLFYQAPTWVFTLVYSLFGLSVAAAWWCFPPRRLGPR